MSFPVKIAVTDKRTNKKYKNTESTWSAIAKRCSMPIRTTETVEEYPKLSRDQQDAAKDCGGFVGGHLREGVRKNGNVICRQIGLLDADHVPRDMDFRESVQATLPDNLWFLYSTHRHTPASPRYRLALLFSREVSEDEYPALMRQIAKTMGMDFFDDSTYQANRMMYWPSCPVNGEFVFVENEGAPLDPDQYLALYKDWHDVTQWPTSTRQSEAVSKTLRQQADPLAKEGVVGAFCRAYSVEDAIAAFLGDVYESSALTGRYDYIPADSSAGVVVYDGKFAYSHHATDPACGKLLNAFDMVRIHRFGDLEDKASFQAMSSFAVRDAQVKEQLTDERQTQALEEFTEENWQSRLQLDRSGAVKDTLTNITTILRFDPALQPIVFNQFKSMIDVIGVLPWPQVKPGWSDTDVACAKIYFERTYGIWSPTKFKDALLGVVSAERLHHPVKEYLGSLAWDGRERLETLLINYLGADDTPYVRAVTRKTFTAAVARIYQPGIKFDSILVLNGVQGIGKSTFFSRLGRKWYSDSLSISDMKDKTAPEKLQGYWILELGELAGIKKMDVETVKSFITRTDDKYRQSYGVTVESHPRSCIIVGTTNSDGGFLRDITGNRRFWPVHVTGNGKHRAWDLMDVDQVWAEAIERYNAGEELFLKGALAEAAASQQREAMESDDREGLVAEYLDTLLADNWDRMDLYSRRGFLTGNEFGGDVRTGAVRREQVCVMEIWCECFGKNREALKKADSYEIESILNKIGGWQKYTGSKTGKKNIPLYGPQRMFVRIP